jgi:S2P endopeptidase
MFDKGVLLTTSLVIGGFWFLFVGLLKIGDVLWPQQVSFFLTQNGLSVSWWSVWFYTNRFNATLGRWGRNWAVFWNWWFSVGVVLCLCVSVVGCLFMALNLGWLLRADMQQPVMTPMLPFVNIPGSELIHYFLALALATGLHELGHALAAASHSCGLDGVGMALITVFPAAFVDLRAQDLEWAPIWVRLKVHCAGAFHNLVLVAVVAVILMLLPLLLLPMFGTGQGLLVLRSRVPGVQAGLIITSLNGCAVTSLHDWAACRDAAVKTTNQAFCVDEAKLLAGAEDHSCCEHGYKGALQCFHAKSKMFCLSARGIILSGSQTCNLTSACHPGSTCVDASLQLDDRLLWIESTTGDAVVLSGPPAWLWSSLLVSERVPRFASWLFGGLDQQMEQLLRYTLSLSAALALLNLLPVHFLDGSHVADAVWSYYGGTSGDPLLWWTKTGMTALLVVNLLLSSRSLFSAV